MSDIIFDFQNFPKKKLDFEEINFHKMKEFFSVSLIFKEI